MKKSLHSLLTAAMFAAAVTTSAGGISNTQNASAAPAENDLITETTTEPQDVYGPPGWFSETETITDVTRNDPPTAYGPPHWFTDTETEAMTTTTTDVTAEIPQPAYGPPWMFAEPGDLNYDFKLDARDLTLLKRYLLEGEINDRIDRLANVNQDGKIDKEDVKELIRRLTGAPEEDPEETDVTTTGTDATVPPRPETTTDPYWDYPLYGPPSAWN